MQISSGFTERILCHPSKPPGHFSCQNRRRPSLGGSKEFFSGTTALDAPLRFISVPCFYPMVSGSRQGGAFNSGGSQRTGVLPDDSGFFCEYCSGSCTTACMVSCFAVQVCCSFRGRPWYLSHIHGPSFSFLVPSTLEIAAP